MIKVNGLASNVLPVTDRGLAYGDGVWETIVIREHQLKQLDKHLARLQKGLTALAIKNLDLSLVRDECHKLESKNENAIVKLIITRGDAQRGYAYDDTNPCRWILSTHELPVFPGSYEEEGVSLFQCDTRLAINPRLAGFKHLNRLEQVLARAEFTAEYQEGLVCDYDDHVIEGTMSNVFVITEDNRIVTPDLSSSGIAGVARSCIIEHCHDLGQPVEVKPLVLHDMNNAKGLFLSNSVIKIWPVKQYQNKHFAIPAIIRTLQGQVNKSL
ncbi:MAG: Aminodeoxychorismate lyase (EC [uncultured Thiotrichaceae bacterium]|uniref:Aminodeoxychorismate lyase n=1 Tax=uncultured Thiotrichaceae bacterium TaxID=298394 RepID=A0A6S6T9G7_9GAMM|nr:MAG: Aminodeoxychorismate lyase (EC [uncultured Thiotrichaceae bacterium]